MGTAEHERRISLPELTDREIKLWYFATFLLLADVLTTWYVIGQVGLVAEANPLMASLMEFGGRQMLFPAKLFVFAMGAILRPITDDGTEWLLPVAVIIPMSLVVILNTLAVLTLAL